MQRQRQVSLRPFPPDRRFVTAAMRAGRRMAPMHGLADVDVTAAREILAASSPGLSFTGFILASVARAAARHPEVHAYRTWSGRLAVHRRVDITTIVEVETPDGPFPLVHVVRDADTRSVSDLSEELRGVKASPSRTTGGRLLERGGPMLARVPGAVETMYLIMARSPRVRQRVGTVAVTSVGMFGGGGGFAIAPLTLMSLQIVVGGVARRPRVIDEQVVIRDVLDLTVSIDHNVVDGAPAARFAAQLRDLIENAEVL